MADKGKIVSGSDEQENMSSRKYHFFLGASRPTVATEPMSLESDEDIGEDSADYGKGDGRDTQRDNVCVRDSSSASMVMLRRGKAGKFVGGVEGGSSSTTGETRKKVKDESWILKKSCPGGPKDISIIPSFGGHIARELWTNPNARGVLTGYNRPKLTELLRFQLPIEVKELVDRSSFAHLGNCMYTGLDMPLLSAFIERWQPDTNTFHMPFGEMSILLHDVERILRIPVEGEACYLLPEESGESGDLDEPVDPVIYMACLLGKSLDQLPLPLKANVSTPLYKSGAVLIEGVKQVLTSTARHEEERAQAYLAMLLGMTLFVDKSGDRIRPHVFPLVSDLEKVAGYAWGAGALAYLYRQLGIATRVDTKGIAGCLTLLQAWIYEYFPRFRPGDRLVTTGLQPRAMCWARGTKYPSDATLLLHYREMLDDLTPQSVDWCPYDRIHPRSLYSGTIRFMEIVEPYQPDRCLRQYGFVQVIPHMMLTPPKVYRPRSGLRYQVEFPSYSDHAWRTWPDHRVVLQDRSRPCKDQVMDHDPKYYPWYASVSHPRLIDPASRGRTTVREDDHVYREWGRALAQTVMPVYSHHSDHAMANYMRANAEAVQALCDHFLDVGEEDVPHLGRRVRRRDDVGPF